MGVWSTSWSIVHRGQYDVDRERMRPRVTRGEWATRNELSPANAVELLRPAHIALLRARHPLG